ncbi:MAG: cytochrome c [Acidobacteriota bacterium]
MLRRSVRTVAWCLFALTVLWFSVGRPWQSYAWQSGGKPLTQAEAKNLKSPVPYSKSSISRGRIVFMNYCTGCHGNDGKAQIDVIADATDLTQPKLWKSGAMEGEIFRSIREGAGLNMPPYKNQIRKEEDMWHLVNFIRSLWSESLRPKLQEEKPDN